MPESADEQAATNNATPSKTSMFFRAGRLVLKMVAAWPLSLRASTMFIDVIISFESQFGVMAISLKWGLYNRT